MYICIYIYIYICKYMYICMYIHIYTYIHTYIQTRIYVYICVSVCIYVYMYICIYTYIHMYIHIYIYIHTYINIHIYTHSCTHEQTHTPYTHNCRAFHQPLRDTDKISQKLALPSVYTVNSLASLHSRNCTFHQWSVWESCRPRA